MTAGAGFGDQKENNKSGSQGGPVLSISSETPRRGTSHLGETMRIKVTRYAVQLFPLHLTSNPYSDEEQAAVDEPGIIASYHPSRRECSEVLDAVFGVPFFTTVSEQYLSDREFGMIRQWSTNDASMICIDRRAICISTRLGRHATKGRGSKSRYLPEYESTTCPFKRVCRLIRGLISTFDIVPLDNDSRFLSHGIAIIWIVKPT
jgi:hypothetical protein